MRILIFGNSITQGFYDTEVGGWANRLAVCGMQKEVGSGEKDFTVFNLGVSGEDVVGIARRFGSEIDARRGRYGDDLLAVLAVGVNDTQVDIKTGEHRTELPAYKEKLQEIVLCAKERHVRVLLVGLAPIYSFVLDPIPWKSTHAYRAEEIERYNAVIREVADEHDLAFIPMQDVFDPVTHTTDGIHPNAEGHRLMFERVKEYLEKQNII